MIGYLSAGDLDFFWDEQIKNLSYLPRIWLPEVGFGWSNLQSLWLDYPFRILIKLLNNFGLSWYFIEKLFWIFVFVLGLYGSYKLARYVLSGSRWAMISSVIYIANTYFLLIFGGGQLGIALAYSLSPYVLLNFMQSIEKSYELRVRSYVIWKNRITNGLWLGLLVCCDLRVAYLVLMIITLYMLLHVLTDRHQILKFIQTLIFSLFVPCGIAFSMHLFWILPVIFVKTGAPLVGSDFTNIGMVTFLSVADLSHTLSFLHPNWPENLFGKVYFLQPEFLIIPIIAFGSLLFIQKKYEKKNTMQKQVLFFAILSLLGVFLAKGTQSPFGEIFVWLFRTIPGFVMFRDPTKFFLFIALGYSVLIPFTLMHVSTWIKGVANVSKKISEIFIVFIFMSFWIYSLRPVFMGYMGGNFKPLKLSNDYILLKNMLVEDTKPYRTLWIPTFDKFVFRSPMHPVLTGDDLWKNASHAALLEEINSVEFLPQIQKSGVRYVIIPADLEKRIFLSDYTFDQGKRDLFIESMKKTGLQKLQGFQKIDVFENPTYDFQAFTPRYVKEQEFWSRVGLVLSGSLCIVFILMQYFKKG